MASEIKNQTLRDPVFRFLKVVHRNGLSLREVSNGNGNGDGTPGKPLTQVAAAERADLSRPSVAAYVKRMRETILLEDSIAIRADAGYAIGVDISETRGARVALSDISGKIIATEVFGGDEDAYLQRQTPGEALDFVEGAIRRLLDNRDGPPIDREQIIGVVVSLPGPVKGGNVIGPEAGIWRHLSAADELSRRLGWEEVPFATQSDSYLSALAENHWTGGQVAQDCLFVKWAARLRVAIVIDGKVHVGHSGSAGELPHQTVKELAEEPRVMPGQIPPPWPPPALEREGLLEACPVCNQVYCLHMVAPLQSISMALTGRPGKKGRPDARASYLVELAEADPEARQILAIAARAIGTAVSPLVDALDPEAVVIGGALGSRAFPLVFEAFTSSIGGGPRSIGGGAMGTESVSVRGGRLEERTAVRGAIALALLDFAPAYLRKLAG